MIICWDNLETLKWDKDKSLLYKKSNKWPLTDDEVVKYKGIRI